MKSQNIAEINSALNQVIANESNRKDIVFKSERMRLDNYGNLVNVDGESFIPTQVFHEQVAEFLEIPDRFYQKLLFSDPGLLVTMVNELIERERFDNDTRMLRTIGRKAIALRSERYQKRDNGQFVESVKGLIDDDNVVISRCDYTDRRFYLNLLFPKLQAEIRKGDVHQYGIHSSNSETGYGTIKTAYMSLRVVCDNGAMRWLTDQVIKHKHLGKVKDLGVVGNDREAARQERIFWGQFQNNFASMIQNTPQVFEKEVVMLKELADRKMEGKPDEVVSKLGKVLELRQAEIETMFTHLIVSEDFTQYGLLQAVTRSAQDAKNSDRAFEIEHLSEKVANLSPSAWKAINN